MGQPFQLVFNNFENDFRKLPTAGALAQIDHRIEFAFFTANLFGISNSLGSRTIDLFVDGFGSDKNCGLREFSRSQIFSDLRLHSFIDEAAL